MLGVLDIMLLLNEFSFRKNKGAIFEATLPIIIILVFLAVRNPVVKLLEDVFNGKYCNRFGYVSSN